VSAGPEKVIRDEIRALTAYHVQSAEGMVKLDAMENPYRLPDGLRREIGEAVANAEINRYPDPTAPALVKRLRKVMESPPSTTFFSATARTKSFTSSSKAWRVRGPWCSRLGRASSCSANMRSSLDCVMLACSSTATSHSNPVLFCAQWPSTGLRWCSSTIPIIVRESILG